MKSKLKHTGLSSPVSSTVIKVLLFCGIIATPIYIGFDILAAAQYEGYSYTDQAISELSAIGAPTAWLWNILCGIFNPLIIAFGIGIWLSAGSGKALLITGILLIIWGIVGFIWLLFPMNMRGAIGSVSDTGHLILSGLTVLIITAFIGFGSGIFGKGFRLYSILTIIAMLAFGALVGMQAPRVAADLPTPWMGIMERISVFAPMIWVMALAILLIKSREKKGSIDVPPLNPN